MSSVEERMMGLFMFLKVVPWLYIYVCLIFGIKKIIKRKEVSGSKNLNFLSERSCSEKTAQQSFPLLAFWKKQSEQERRVIARGRECRLGTPGGANTWCSH